MATESTEEHEKIKSINLFAAETHGNTLKNLVGMAQAAIK
jgi:hypothetical protein